MVTFKEKIAKDVKKRRKELKMSQEDMCDYAEVAIGTYSKFENAKANLNMENFEKILDVLGLDFEVKVKGIVDETSSDF